MYKIYIAKHVPTDSVYVGVTSKDLLLRIGQHLAVPEGSREKFQEFLHCTEYSEWSWEVLEEINDRKIAYRAESEYIKDYSSRHPCLNTTGVVKIDKPANHLKPYQFKKGQKPHNKGKKGVSEETRQKMRIAKLRNPVKVEWTEEMREAARAGQKNKKPVQCIETGQIFVSMSEACKVMGLSRSNLRNHLKGVYKTVRGYTFKFVED